MAEDIAGESSDQNQVNDIDLNLNEITIHNQNSQFQTIDDRESPFVGELNRQAKGGRNNKNAAGRSQAMLKSLENMRADRNRSEAVMRAGDQYDVQPLHMSKQ